MDFKDLQNPEDLVEASEKDKGKDNIKSPKIEGVKDTISQLSQLSDDQLIDELTKQLKIKKNDGTLGDLEKLVRMLNPFLSKEQKDRLANIVKSMQNK